MNSLQLRTEAGAKENHTTLGTVEALLVSKGFFLIPRANENVARKKAHQIFQSRAFSCVFGSKAIILR